MAAATPAPLAGFRVLDLTRLLPGPLCGQYLADLGADVVKIEDTQAGDYARPSLRALVNRGKKSLSLNLKTDKGREVFLSLADKADVLLESFRPGTMRRLGLDYDLLASRNPRLVYCAISGFGQTGPRSLEAGHDINFQALAGILHQTGSKGSPVIPGFLIADLAGGTLSAATGIMAALLRAQRTGRGGLIDVSMADSLLSLSAVPIALANEGRKAPAGGTGPHTGGTAHYNVYRTRDGRYLAIGAQEAKFWRTFCEAIGRPDLQDRHGPDTDGNGDLIAEVQAAIQMRSLHDWQDIFRDKDCCVSPVLTIEEALNEPHFRQRGTVRQGDAGYSVGLPFSLSGYATDPDRRAPAQGQHTREVLAWLGYTREDIERMLLEGVAATPETT